jgi:hypothetical protein
MAANVFAAALRNSQAEGNDRNVLLALADCAWRDGVTWILVGDDKDDEGDTICRLARVSRSTASRSIRYLRDVAGEIETVKVRKGRSYVTVYRVLHGAAEIDYERIPFELPHRFDEQSPIQGVNLTRSIGTAAATESGVSSGELVELHRVNLTRSTGAAGDGSTCHDDAVQCVNSGGFNVSPPRARDTNDGTVREPAAEPRPSTAGASAAERPPTDREISEVVMSLPGADVGSPKVVIPIAHGLPVSVFLEVADRVRDRRGRVGLLVDLLRLARGERTAALSAQLARQLGQHARAYVPAPWLIDSLKREDPERYVRVMAAAPGFPVELIAEAFHGRDDVADLVELARRVRAGGEPADRIGTPEQERRRWVEAHATDPDVARTIDAWDDVDPIERQELHELAERLLRESTTRRESEAA